MRIEWRPAARDDLLGLIRYIAEDNVPAAFAVSERIEAAVEALTRHPLRGRPSRVKGTRELVVPRIPYLVIYRPGDPVVILRILHGARQWPPAP